MQHDAPGEPPASREESTDAQTAAQRHAVQADGHLGHRDARQLEFDAALGPGLGLQRIVLQHETQNRDAGRREAQRIASDEPRVQREPVRAARLRQDWPSVAVFLASSFWIRRIIGDWPVSAFVILTIR